LTWLASFENGLYAGQSSRPDQYQETIALWVAAVVEAMCVLSEQTPDEQIDGDGAASMSKPGRGDRKADW
jgi:hypothetical protein